MKTAKNVLLSSVITVILSLIIALNAVLTCFAQITPKGDLNGDGVVNSADFVFLRQALLKESEKEYDINGDGEFNLKDLVRLKKIAVDFDKDGKFLVNFEKQLINGKTYKLGELFKIKDGCNVDSSKVEFEGTYDNGIEYEFTKDVKNWENSTVKFEGTGEVQIGICEYCIPTEANFTVVNADKFDIVFENTDKYLYRVGNQNTVALGSLFKAKNGADIDSASVTVEKSDSNGNVSGSYTADNSDWKKGTIKFEGTGPVKVTIQEEGRSNPLTLGLEVVDAVNATKYDEIENYNVTSVLLNDITMSNNSSLYLNGGATIYGNGFTLDCTNGAYTATGSVSENYVIGLVDAHLDNVKIIGKVYTTYGAQASNDYNRALVLSKGNSSITNCYISNTASPVRLVEGSLEIKGTTVKGGNFANIDVRNGHLTVEDVTTINQSLGNDKSGDTTIIGLGIVVYYENVDSALTSVEIKGKLTQYNNISSNDKFNHDYATTFVSEMMKSDYSDFQTVANGVTWVNTGIVSMSENITLRDNRSEKNGYIEKAVSLMSKSGYVYTVKPSSESISISPPEYKTFGQGIIAPEYSFDYKNKNYIAKTEGSNDYCYEENGKVLVAMDQGDTFEWDPFILTATKFGKSLDYEVSFNGKNYSAGEKIAFNTSGDYVVTYTYSDENNFIIDAAGELENISKTYTKTVNISVSVIKPAAKHADFTFGSSNNATEKVTIGDKTYISAKSVSATDKQWGYITVSGTKIFYPIIDAQMKKNFLGSEVQVFYYVFKDAVTITDYKDSGTGGEQKYDSSTTTNPNNLEVVNGMETKYTSISSACVDISKLTKDGPSGEVWDFSASTTVSNTTTYNGYLAYQSPSGLSIKSGTRDYDAITVAQFSYKDAAGATYYYFIGYFMPNQVSSSGSGGGGCVTPDTLVTLADGTQKRIDNVTYSDKLLVWDFYKGEYTVMPSSIVMNHGYDNYDIVTLNFDDGTQVKTINGHGFFDVKENKFVIIEKDNVEQYVGHSFLKDAEKMTVAKLISYSIYEEYTESWSILTAVNYNCILEGMLTLTPAEVEGSPDYLMPYAIGEGMKYDSGSMQMDIEKYGLYTYEDFKEYCTYEQFVAFGFENFKVSVGKGYIIWDDIKYLLKIHLGS